MREINDLSLEEIYTWAAWYDLQKPPKMTTEEAKATFAAWATK